jgi:general stress protein YciG
MDTMTTRDNNNPGKSRRGFASMDEAMQREIASLGGRTAHVRGLAHEFTPEEARSAGRKGGVAVSRDREHMAEIGRMGGLARGRNQKKREHGATENGTS